MGWKDQGKIRLGFVSLCITPFPFPTHSLHGSFLLPYKRYIYHCKLHSVKTILDTIVGAGCSNQMQVTHAWVRSALYVGPWPWLCNMSPIVAAQCNHLMGLWSYLYTTVMLYEATTMMFLSYNSDVMKLQQWCYEATTVMLWSYNTRQYVCMHVCAQAIQFLQPCITNKTPVNPYIGPIKANGNDVVKLW